MYQYLEKLPLRKVISPKTHRKLDYLTIGTFLGMAGLWWRHNRKPAIAALGNGLFVLGYTALTDFEGNGKRPLSFATHGKFDRIQAGMAGVAPNLLGFAEEKKTLFFRGQAINETMVIAMTDFEANKIKHKIRRAA
jgi:hypothetical protein